VCEYGLRSSGSEWGPVACSSEHGDESSGSITGLQFLDELVNYRVVKTADSRS
jgi:hypothetical protein